MALTSNQRSSRWLFFRKFVTQGTRVASVAPSSRALAQTLVRHVDPARAQTIIELGAGDGAVTHLAAERKHPESRLLAIERDGDFAAALRRRTPGATVIHGDVIDLRAALANHHVHPEQVDLVISGLPTPSLPLATNQALFDWLATLPETVVYSQLTVMPWVYKPFYQRLFDQVLFTPVLRNLPPGGAYHCTSLKPDYARHLPGA